MQRKKPVFLVLVLLLLCLCAFAAADTQYVKTPDGKTVNMRDRDHKVIAHIPYGTALEPISDECTEVVACVTYNGLKGYVNWRYLVTEKPPKYRKASSASAEPTPEPGITGEGPYSVSVTGGVLQFQNKKGKASGEKYSKVQFEEPVSLVVTAVVPKKMKIDSWVINGVRLQTTKKSIGILLEEGENVIEIIYK